MDTDPVHHVPGRCVVSDLDIGDMARDYENISLDNTDGVARLVFQRPHALNALNRPMLTELMAALDEIRDGHDTRVLVISGAGRAFSSGADLSGGSSNAGSTGFDAGQVLEQFYNPLIERLFALPVPIVASVRGPVVGAGCMIALSADIVLAARTSYFLQAFVNIGLVPDAGSMWLLPRLIGRARAQAMMLLGERVTAETALEWGMIYQVVDDAALEARTDEILAKLAVGPTRAYELIRLGIRAALEQPLSHALAMERVAQRHAGLTGDFSEGVAAFREKRVPAFKGR